MRFILKKIKEKEDRKTFSGKKKALFSLTKGTNKLCYGFLAKWKDTMFLKIRLSYKVRQNISHSQSTKFYVYGSYKIFLLKKSVCLSGPLEYRQGTYGEHFWTINQILVHQSNLCNVNTDLKSKVVSLHFMSVICNIIYFQILP